MTLLSLLVHALKHIVMSLYRHQVVTVMYQQSLAASVFAIYPRYICVWWYTGGCDTLLGECLSHAANLPLRESVCFSLGRIPLSCAGLAFTNSCCNLQFSFHYLTTRESVRERSCTINIIETKPKLSKPKRKQNTSREEWTHKFATDY